MTYPYTQSEYDAFGWSPLSKASLPPAETVGLDYESAAEATPRWFAVSFGNGNDGVSHMFPDYYVRTDDPWTLARAAMIGSFKADWYQWAHENCETDGEADYTIAATIYNPPDDDDADDDSGCNVNGAWQICEVFPAADYDLPLDPAELDGRIAAGNPERPAYDSLVDCFDDDVLKLAASD